MASTLTATGYVARIEAPVTWKAYLLCAFASIGGIYSGSDIGVRATHSCYASAAEH